MKRLLKVFFVQLMCFLKLFLSKKKIIVVIFLSSYSNIVFAEMQISTNSDQIISALIPEFFIIAEPSISEAGEIIQPKRRYKIKQAQGSNTAAVAVAEFYEINNFNLLWEDNSARNALLQELEKLRDDGLNPDDYQLSMIRNMPTDSLSAHNDFLLSASLMRALYHLSRGKVNEDGTAAVWNFSLNDFPMVIRENIIRASFSEPTITQLFDFARPTATDYINLRDAYIRLKQSGAEVHLPEVNGTGLLKECEQKPEIAQLRARLIASGDYVAPATSEEQYALAKECIEKSLNTQKERARAQRERERQAWQEAQLQAEFEGNSYTTSVEPSAWSIADETRFDIDSEIKNADWIYDKGLVEAVKQFQDDNFLNADGIVGDATRRALNISPEYRLEQVKINLDRARWRLHRMSSHMVLVDLAGFSIHYIQDNVTRWQSRVQIGLAYRKSPVIDSAISHITLNPTWTVPPTILRKDILPKVRRDPGYLARNRIKAYDRDGRVLDPYSVNWNNASGITLRQAAGPQGALGRAAIRFPNNHAVYLHDTPHQALFNKNERATSSGCVRVENAMDLVYLLLGETPEWSASSIDNTINRGKTQNARLSRGVPILIAYWTVDALSPTNLKFKGDVYDRDPAMIAALAQF